ncbi:G-box-binding factor 2 [Arabidopsis thaliana]
MGSNEEGNPTNNSDKPSQAAAPEQSNVHVYHHDWAAMQAYYGPRVGIPQYYNSNVAPGHAPPPYMWASPSPMMAPYGAPYPPFCPPGGVYAHPGVQMGSQPQGPVSQSASGVTTPLTMDAPANSAGNSDQGFMKKLKEFDGLAMSISNNKVGSAEHSSSEHRSSQSSENDGSSNGSDGNTTGGEQSRRKRRQQRSPSTGERPSSQNSLPLRGENEKPDVTMGTPVMPTAMSFQNSAGMNGVPQPWNEKEVKREKRKQSNRESARRSRLRKQAETEQLSVKVDALVAENMSLRSKLGQLNNESEKLRLENESLLDQLKAQAKGKTENLISRVDKNNSVSGSKTVQHQLLNASPITDPVAAS